MAKQQEKISFTVDDPRRLTGPRRTFLYAPAQDRVVERVTFTVDEVADRTGLSRTFLFAEIRAGRLPSMKIGKNRLIHIDDERAYLNAHRQQKAA